MKVRIEICENQEEDIIILAKEMTDTVKKIQELLVPVTEIIGYKGDEFKKLEKGEIYAVFVETGKVYALTEKDKWQVKLRLYQLEDALSGDFVKINQSCLVSVGKIEKFRASLGGALSVILKNGYTDYISRRQLKEVKERMSF